MRTRESRRQETRRQESERRESGRQETKRQVSERRGPGWQEIGRQESEKQESTKHTFELLNSNFLDEVVVAYFLSLASRAKVAGKLWVFFRTT